MIRSKKYASYTDDQIVALSSANLSLVSKSYLDIELAHRGLKQHVKNKNINALKSERSYKTYLFIAVSATFLALRMLERYT